MFGGYDVAIDGKWGKKTMRAAQKYSGSSATSIDELYEEICAENPSVSLATVYKNLNMLKDEGLVVEVNMPNQKARYDIFSYPHIHVVCESCGHVEDYNFCEALSEYKENLERKLGNFIEKMNVLVTVKDCKNCRH